MFGVWNKIVRIDLSGKSICTDSFSEDTWKMYIGGSGIGTKILYEEVPENTDPLSPDNKIIFAAGPFQGTTVPGSGKWTIVGKSPLTGTFAVSTAGASFGWRLKKAGIDAVVFEGASDTPCYIVIDDDHIEILDAKHLWGLDAIEASNAITATHGRDYRTAVIGTAGEKMVGAACIMSDCHSFAARCGLGAVLGSKKC
jgi:aldehyde:ferredoxin oxidoreductase